MLKRMLAVGLFLCFGLTVLFLTKGSTPTRWPEQILEPDIPKLQNDGAIFHFADIKFRPGQVFCVDKPIKIGSPLSWYAQWTKWMQQDKGEAETRDLWHCDLIVSPSQRLQITGVGFNALRLVPTGEILNTKDRNAVVYDFGLTDAESKVVAQAAWDIYLRGGAPFNHLVPVGLTLSNLGNKTGLWPHWGWPERNIRYGFICPEFVAYCFSKIGIYFRSGMDWWEGTTTDDIDDYALKNGDIVYQNWVG